MITTNNNNTGTALFSALLITAIAAILSAAILVSVHYSIRQTQLILSNEQLYEYLYGTNFWGEMTIKKIISDPKQFQDIGRMATKIQGTRIRARIVPQYSLFNINCLSQTNNQVRFRRLLKAVNPNINSEQAQQITEAITDWVIKESSDDTYLEKEIPYRASHKSIVSVSELKAINGIDPELYLDLKNYITALPSNDCPVDVNYAKVPVLMSLDDRIDATRAKDAAECALLNGPYKDVDTFLKECGPPLGPVPKNNLTIDEPFYSIVSFASNGEQRLVSTSLVSVNKDTEKKEIHLKVIWQQLSVN